MQDGHVVHSDDKQKKNDVVKKVTETNAGSLNRRSNENPEDTDDDDGYKEIELPAVVGRDDEEYNMRNPRRGIAVVFHHRVFKDLETRIGSEKDVKPLHTILQDLGFQVRLYKDFNQEQVLETLRDTAAEDHGECDCLLVVVMTHGDTGYLYAFDTMYPVQQLWLNFTGEKCPSLAGKPKLFFIQCTTSWEKNQSRQAVYNWIQKLCERRTCVEEPANGDCHKGEFTTYGRLHLSRQRACRGNKIDSGVVYGSNLRKMAKEEENHNQEVRYTIPNIADFLIAHSTIEGFTSHRNPQLGSWFIQSLCEELQTNGRSRDLLTILTFVCRRVALNYESIQHGQRIKQIPAITSLLTRLLYFR